MPEEDVKDSEKSSVSDQSSDDESQKHAAADSDKSDGDESKSIPYSRFKEINDAKKQAEKVANWYRENVGDPNDVVEYKKWKAQQVKEAEKKKEEGSLTAQQLAEIREVMRKADPEYAQFLENQKLSAKEREEAQFDEAADYVRELAEEKLGLKYDANEADVNHIAELVMLAIQKDEKLYRMWRVGKTERAVSGGFKAVESFLNKFGGGFTKLKQDAAEKRKVSKLPTLPSAAASLSSRKQDKDRPKGITKHTHEDAWALIQQSMQE